MHDHIRLQLSAGASASMQIIVCTLFGILYLEFGLFFYFFLFGITYFVKDGSVCFYEKDFCVGGLVVFVSCT